MIATNLHPFANSFNQSRFRNFSYSQPTEPHQFAIHKPTSPKDLTVPEPKPYDPDAYRKLTVPNSDIPYFDGPIPAYGFLGNSSLLKLADGSVIDLKAKKIVYDPNIRWKAQGYWNDPNYTIKRQGDQPWGKNETIEEMLNRIDNGDGTYADPNMSPESIKYWQKANEESKKLEQNLTDEQKELLSDLHSGKIFPLSKLVDEK